MKRKRLKLKIIERHLDVERARGLAWPDGETVEIDPRQPPRMYLDSLVHELLHIGDWDLNERKVRRLSRVIATGLWKQGYRRMKYAS